MSALQKIFPNMYRDSVALMRLSAEASDLPGIEAVSAIMATEANIALLAEAGLLDGATDAGPNDLLLVIQGGDDTAITAGAEFIESALTETAEGPSEGGGAPALPHSIETALGTHPAANLALISCPGEYAGAEAMKALRLGLDVMLFSDNVALEDEVALKTMGDELGRLVMGPDCGTAIINGVPLGFANVVRPGNIGLVAASGTGLQQVSCLIDDLGGGISQAIGTGGRDLKSQVGGRAMIRGLEMLASDPGTEVIVLISKPPDADVAKRLMDLASACAKPVIVNFLGADGGAGTLEEAAHLAVAAGNGETADIKNLPRHNLDADALEKARAALGSGQGSIRALYSGGTFAYESMLILQPLLGTIWSSSPLNPDGLLNDPWQSRGHTVIDLGDDIFTRGRPHPMIDHRLRGERILQEAADAETAVILLDLVLGYGSHDDPAGELATAINQARDIAEAAGHWVHFVGFVCGTDADPQHAARQAEVLGNAGVLLTPSNAQAARLAADIVGSGS
ncbi:MAG: acyl-CoA synthetase FdrA [Rhodospirillaceae bacterium]|nr:acyl-CoA synthetase FdrA [Rhodospirillaceae bacterium]MBT7233039.1 acyl-CoA synthetase FdrA [Rhodospirillaceae bacterium]MBT7571269.1 acyl-CoA synthetase FdrA [Rhodospirillaceae bacterium]